MRLLQPAFLVALASGFAAIFIYITGVSNLHGKLSFSDEDLEALQSLQSGFQKCVSANGLGLQAFSRGDYCQTTMKFPSDTTPKWVRNSTTILTKEFIDSLPNGWEDYAWCRINKGVKTAARIKGKAWRNFHLCSLKRLGISLSSLELSLETRGIFLKTKFGKEIDKYDAVFRENGAPIENYTENAGRKSTFRLLNRGSAKALDKVVELDESRKEVLIIKTTIADIMNQMIREIPIKNPVYLMLGASFGSAAKGTGLKALEFALSICDSADMYGFTVDPGYKEWTRCFSESRQGHTTLHGWAYYQMMECLGLINFHSPMRADLNRVVKWVPDRSAVKAVRIASEKILRRAGAGSGDPLGSCSIVKKQVKRKRIENLRRSAIDHQKCVRDATMYPLEHNPEHGMLCTMPTS